MALPPTEIRYSKYALYFIVAVTIFVSAGMLLSLFWIKPSWHLYLIHLLGVLVAAFFIRRLFVKYRSNAPVLVFESHALTTSGRTIRTIPWSVILEWKIKSYKNSHQLVIRTSSEKVKVDISWLDRNTRDIQSLMEAYIREPGPNGLKR